MLISINFCKKPYINVNKCKKCSTYKFYIHIFIDRYTDLYRRLFTFI